MWIWGPGMTQPEGHLVSGLYRKDWWTSETQNSKLLNVIVLYFLLLDMCFSAVACLVWSVFVCSDLEPYSDAAARPKEPNLQ